MVERQTPCAFRISMSLSDILIIYFAGGAPFAVYYYLQNRHSGAGRPARLKNALVFLFWIPYAVSLFLRKRKHFGFLKSKFSSRAFIKESDEKKIYSRQKQIENLLFESDSDVSLFDFREIFERYAGLTLAAENEASGESEREIFRVSKNENVELGAICLRRRNRNKLVRHQTEARRDFLQIIERLAVSISDTESLQLSAFEIVKIFDDTAAREILEKMFAPRLQTDKLQSVEYTEKDLWKTPEPHQPLRAETISTR